MGIHAHASLQYRYAHTCKLPEFHSSLSPSITVSSVKARTIYYLFNLTKLNKMNRLAKRYKLVHACIVVFI